MSTGWVTLSAQCLFCVRCSYVIQRWFCLTPTHSCMSFRMPLCNILWVHWPVFCFPGCWRADRHIPHRPTSPVSILPCGPFCLHTQWTAKCIAQGSAHRGDFPLHCLLRPHLSKAVASCHLFSAGTYNLSQSTHSTQLGIFLLLLVVQYNP